MKAREHTLKRLMESTHVSLSGGRNYKEVATLTGRVYLYRLHIPSLTSVPGSPTKKEEKTHSSSLHLL